MSKKRDAASGLKALSRLSLFGPPPLLESEDSAAYDELLARASGAVKPADIIDEILVRDFVDRDWELARLLQFKTNLLASAVPAALELILAPLIRRRQPSKTEGVTGLSFDFISAPPSPAHKLVKKWAAGNPAAINRVNKLLASANVKMDIVIANAFVNKFDQIERIDRHILFAEGRRNAALREIDRHRTTLAPSFRQTIRDVEGEFRVVEPTNHHRKKTKNKE